MIIRILLISLVIGVIYCGDGCRTIQALGGTGGLDPSTAKDLKICKGIKTTCCSADDFSALAGNYNGPEVTQEPLSMRYQRRAEQSMRAISEGLRLSSTAIARSKAIKAHSDASDECKTAAEDISNFQIGELVEDLNKTASACWTIYDKVKLGVFCAMCDSDYQSSFTKQTNTILYNKAECLDLLPQCNNHIGHMVRRVYPYFTNLEVLSRCGIDGKLSQKPAIEKDAGISGIKVKLDNCVNGNLQSQECFDICNKLFVFGEENSLIHGSSDFLVTTVYNLKKNYDLSIESFTDQEKKDVASVNKYYKDKQMGNEPSPPTDKYFYKVDQLNAVFGASSVTFGKLFNDSNLKSLDASSVLKYNLHYSIVGSLTILLLSIM